MSGPKSFSVTIFNKRLKHIFSLQSKINSLFQEINGLAVKDIELSISFDCSDYVAENEEKINSLLKTFELGYSGTVDQKKHDIIENKIESKIEELNSQIDSLESQKKSFIDKRQDYVSYVSYNEYYNNSLKSFDQFKTNLNNYLEKNIEKENPLLAEESKKQVSAINPSIKKSEFKFGFRKLEEESKKLVKKQIDENEEKASEIRNKIAKDKLVKSLTDHKSDKPNTVTETNKEKEKLIAKIHEKIESIEDQKQKEKFGVDLDKLMKSEVLTDPYFYKEFLDKLSQSAKTQTYKQSIRDHIFELNNLDFGKTTLNKKNKLLQQAVEMLESETIKQYLFENFEAQCHFLIAENAEILQDEYIKKKSGEFLKSQLVNGLKNMNYQVMDDMEVIDFEKQSDFLFKVPEQNNYINLRIDKENNIAYNFLIAENKNELSIESKKKKVIEMEQCCKSFKDVLKDLENMGLEINQTKANEANMEMLMQVPEKYKKKIEQITEEQERGKEQIIKKKYLNK